MNHCKSLKKLATYFQLTYFQGQLMRVKAKKRHNVKTIDKTEKATMKRKPKPARQKTKNKTKQKTKPKKQNKKQNKKHEKSRSYVEFCSITLYCIN